MGGLPWASRMGGVRPASYGVWRQPARAKRAACPLAERDRQGSGRRSHGQLTRADDPVPDGHPPHRLRHRGVRSAPPPRHPVGAGLALPGFPPNSAPILPPRRGARPCARPDDHPVPPLALCPLLTCRPSTPPLTPAIPVPKRPPEMDGRVWAGTESVPVGTGYHRPPLPRASLPQYHDWPQRAGQLSSCEADAGQRGALSSGAHAVIPARRRSGGLVASRSRNPVSPADGGGSGVFVRNRLGRGTACRALCRVRTGPYPPRRVGARRAVTCST